MRFFYLILYLSLKYSARLFFARLKTVNSPRTFLGRTIYVSNHAASFMDPLVVATFRPPIVFFLTRSDVFTPLTRPLLRSAHMIPIYRQHDGLDTKGENLKTFEKCKQVLRYGRNLLIFGEGFTDDVFIRRLKPIKKGAVRIGFLALESMKWKKKIYIAAVGCNYSDPNRMRSDLLISTSHRICLNDFQTQYEENPNKTITDLTKQVEKLMKEQITHIDRKEWCDFHDQVMQLTRKGMHAINSNFKIPLVKRWHYSQQLAHWLNEQTEEDLKQLEELKAELSAYFSLQKRLHIKEQYVYEMLQKKTLNRSKEIIMMILLFPFAVLGLIHCGLPYFGVKKFVERSFKRKVFWGSVKLLLGMISMGLLNLPIIFLFHTYVYPNYWMAVLYYLLIGLFGLSAYLWWTYFLSLNEKRTLAKVALDRIIEKRNALKQKIDILIPVI